MPALACPAANGDRVAAGQFQRRRSAAEGIVKGKARRFLDADSSGADAAFSEPLRCHFRGVFVLLPGAHLDGPELQLAQPALLKGGADKHWLASPRDHQGQQPLAEPPANAGVVVEPSSGSEVERRELWFRFCHQTLRMLDAALELFSGNRTDTIVDGF